MAKQETPSRGTSRRSVRPSGGTVIMLVTVLLGVTVLAPTLQQFIQQRQRIADLQNHIAVVETEISELQTEQARWNDPAYIEAQARGRLLFVTPGDTSYLVTDS
ncbi:MAG: septum formation initiator family protein, partial [Pseudoclavibacter sp.]